MEEKNFKLGLKERDIESKEEEEEPLGFSKILSLMWRIVNNHRRDTIIFERKYNLIDSYYEKDLSHRYDLLDLYFDKGKVYEYSILERLYYSKAVFSKMGCYLFIQILELMKRDGVKKVTKEPLKQKEKEKIDKEIKELKEKIRYFNERPDFTSPYLRDRFVARDFKENLTYGAFKSLDKSK